MEPPTEKTGLATPISPKKQSEIFPINPLLSQLRTNPRVGNGEWDFFTTRSKFRMFYRKMVPPPSQKVQKVILCIHGLHSHGEKFILLADKFIKFDWATYAVDLRGHGYSWSETEPRGDVENYQEWIEDGVDFLAYLHELYPKQPIYLIAESMGAGLAVHIAMTHPPGLQGLFFLSPALKPIPQVKLTMALQTMIYGQIAATKNVIKRRENGVLVTNTEIYRQYLMTDPLRLTEVTPRYYFQVLSMLGQLKHFKFDPFYPVVVFYGSEDHFVDFKGIREFIFRVNNKDKALHYIPLAFHEMLTDLQAVRYGLYKKIVAWIHLH
jgi:alpha-beta hydrolase superfamily lysophospholipase